MLVSGSELSGQRRRQGAKMMARALGDMRFTSSSRATLYGDWQLESDLSQIAQQGPMSWCRTSREYPPGSGWPGSWQGPPQREWQQALA